MKKWEYKILAEPLHRADLEGSLNAMGEQGWELTGCGGTTGTNLDTNKTFLLFFKREIPGQPESDIEQARRQVG